MRLMPYDDDTLYQVEFDVMAPVDQHPEGARHAATFAANWLEACHMVRNKYGADKAAAVEVRRVYVIEKLDNGQKVDHPFYESARAVS